MLKPGGRFACLDWFTLKNYDPNNATHLDLMRRIKPLIGAIGTVPVETFVDKLKEAGFKSSSMKCQHRWTPSPPHRKCRPLLHEHDEVN